MSATCPGASIPAPRTGMPRSSRGRASAGFSPIMWRACRRRSSMPISTSEPKDMNALRGDLLARAKEAGFDDAGIARADARSDLPERLQTWLALGRHGQMGWMEETAARRADPLTLWPDAKSVVMLAMNYGPESDPHAALE